MVQSKDYIKTHTQKSPIPTVISSTHTHCLGRQSLNHWTTREVPTTENLILNHHSRMVSSPCGGEYGNI